MAEAMALGLFCIGSDHCDMPELIIDNRTGFLFGEGNIEELAMKLSSIPHEIGTITRAARRLIEDKFDLRLQLQTLASIYCECSSSGSLA
jgi:colanic acid/amylovoran biosynthesis glycosyltransferase